MGAKAIVQSLTRVAFEGDRPRRQPSKMVAIVIPVSQRPALLPEEEISLRHLNQFLGHYDKYFVAPRGLPLQLEGFTRLDFSSKFFGSMPAYNRLMYLPRLYEAFGDYKYILMYHLDSLVFFDELMAWCRTDLDFVGAPWLPCPELPWVKAPGVGNGGFALMKIQSVLDVLYTRYRMEPMSYWKDVAARNLSRLIPAAHDDRPPQSEDGTMGKIRGIWGRIQSTESNRVLNDVFWGRYATKYCPEFRIPDWQVALRFAFEASPRQCFELNNRRLPFGCHAWAKYDRAFWEPYLLRS